MSIYEQLQDFCGCECDNDTTEQNVNELVNLISNATCWTGEDVCSTFLMSSRKEVIDLPSCPDKCFIFEYKPFYKPFDVCSFTLQLVEQDGINETITELTDEDFAYSQTDKSFKIKLPYAEDKCGCKCKSLCSCDKTYKLVAMYDAGYEEIPECLLPVFCQMLDLINKKNECGCNNCNSCNDEPNTENKPNYGEYSEGDALTFAIVNEFGPMLTKQYRNELGLISLCEDAEEWYGEVV